jgi:hypothetical protein
MFPRRARSPRCSRCRWFLQSHRGLRSSFLRRKPHLPPRSWRPTQALSRETRKIPIRRIPPRSRRCRRRRFRRSTLRWALGSSRLRGARSRGEGSVPPHIDRREAQRSILAKHDAAWAKWPSVHFVTTAKAHSQSPRKTKRAKDAAARCTAANYAHTALGQPPPKAAAARSAKAGLRLRRSRQPKRGPQPPPGALVTLALRERRSSWRVPD